MKSIFRPIFFSSSNKRFQLLPMPFLLTRIFGTTVCHWLAGLVVEVAELSLRSPRFIPRAVYVKLVTNEVALGQVFLQVLLFCPVRVIPPKLYSNVSFIDHRHHINSATGTVVKWNTSLYPAVTNGSRAVKSFPPVTVTIRSPPSPPGSLSNQEDGSSAFPQNVDNLLPYYKVTHVKRQYSSIYKVSERKERAT
jgi:hypothetical protein